MSTIALATPGTASLTPEEGEDAAGHGFRLDDESTGGVVLPGLRFQTELNADLRSEFAERLLALRQQQSTKSPLGWVVIGSGGSGKTHWLSICRAKRSNSRLALCWST